MRQGLTQGDSCTYEFLTLFQRHVRAERVPSQLRASEATPVMYCSISRKNLPPYSVLRTAFEYTWKSELSRPVFTLSRLQLKLLSSATDIYSFGASTP